MCPLFKLCYAFKYRPTITTKTLNYVRTESIELHVLNYFTFKISIPSFSFLDSSRYEARNLLPPVAILLNIILYFYLEKLLSRRTTFILY